MQQYRNKNGLDDLRRAQRFAAKMVLTLATVLVILAACAPVAPAHAQDSNATLPPYQRCALVGRVAHDAVQDRDAGSPEQDSHIRLDQTDRLAAHIVHSWYTEPRGMDTPPDVAAEITRSACMQNDF